MSLPHKSHHKTFRPRTTPLRRERAEPVRRGYRSRLGTAPKSERRKLKYELDRLTSLIVRARDGRCVTCGTTEGLQCSHFYSRRWVNTRFDLRNCNAMCAGCNYRHNVDQNAYTAYMVKAYGLDAIGELFELRNKRETPADDELRALRDSYRAMLREMR